MSFAQPAAAARLTPSHARGAVLAALILGVCGLSGCSHVVHIDSTPGAEILVNGESIGRSPATYTETTGAQDSVQVTARLKGRERTVSVERKDIDPAPIGVGAAVGVGACGAGLVVAVVAAFIFAPCAGLIGLASWGMLASAPLAGWAWFGHRLPDAVHVDLGEYASPVSVDDARNAHGEERLAAGEPTDDAETLLPEADVQARDPQDEIASQRADAAHRTGAKRRLNGHGKSSGATGRASY